MYHWSFSSRNQEPRKGGSLDWSKICEQNATGIAWLQMVPLKCRYSKILRSSSLSQADKFDDKFIPQSRGWNGNGPKLFRITFDSLLLTISSAGDFGAGVATTRSLKVAGGSGTAALAFFSLAGAHFRAEGVGVVLTASATADSVREHCLGVGIENEPMYVSDAVKEKADVSQCVPSYSSISFSDSVGESGL